MVTAEVTGVAGVPMAAVVAGVPMAAVAVGAAFGGGALLMVSTAGAAGAVGAPPAA